MNQPQVVQFDSGEVISGKKSGKLISGWSEPWPHTPARNNFYMYPEWAADLVVWLRSGTEPLYIFGPTGCGKTSGIKQLASLLNYPVYEVTGHNRLEFPEMVGHHAVQQGNMIFAYGPLSLAMKYGGIFLLNEIDLLDPSTAAGLNSVLDGAPLTIPENGGECIQAHPMFKFVATANSSGGGDQTGYYQGVLRQNIALMDRFVMVEADYLPPQIEKSILTRQFPGLPADLVDKMIHYAGAVRKLFVGEASDGLDTSIEVTMSTRSLCRWSYLINSYEALRARNIDVVKYALQRALIFRASKPTQVTLSELYQRLWG